MEMHAYLLLIAAFVILYLGFRFCEILLINEGFKVLKINALDKGLNQFIWFNSFGQSNPQSKLDLFSRGKTHILCLHGGMPPSDPKLGQFVFIIAGLQV